MAEEAAKNENSKRQLHAGNELQGEVNSRKRMTEKRMDTVYNVTKIGWIIIILLLILTIV